MKPYPRISGIDLHDLALFSPMHNIKTLFNREYFGIADLWLDGAIEPTTGRKVQTVIRDHLLSIEMYGSGYVNTHQHFSHGHDWGWPFPVWPQLSYMQMGYKGLTAGWHFNKIEPTWFIAHSFNHDPSLPARHAGENAMTGWQLDGGS